MLLLGCTRGSGTWPYAPQIGDMSPLLYVDPSQRDEAERIGGDTADASDSDVAAADTDSREAEKVDTVQAEAGEQTLSVEQEASPAEVRGCLFLFDSRDKPM